MKDVTKKMTKTVPTNFSTDVNADITGNYRLKGIERKFGSGNLTVQSVVTLDGKKVGYGVSEHVSKQQGFKAKRVFV